MTLLAISRVNRGIPAWLSFACAVTTLAGPLAFGALVPTASINNFAAWPLGGLSGMAVALYFGRPRSWESVVTLLGLQMFVWVPAYLGYWDGVDGLSGALSATPAALSTIGPFVIGVAFAREISRLRKVASNAAEEAEIVAQFTARSIARESAFAERLGHVRDEVVPLLTMVASAKLSEPRWQEASARFEQLARDELHVPGVLNGKAREALYIARAHGCAVSFHVPDADIQNPDVVRKLIFADDIVNFDDSPEATWVEVAPRTTVPARPAA